MKLRYPIKTHDRLYPKDTEVRLATLSEARQCFPGISHKADSQQCSIWLPDALSPMIVLKQQITQ